MNTTQYDSRTADKFVVRLPDGLRGQIEEAAGSLDRSMNSVIVQAVRHYLDNQNRQELLLDALAEAVSATAEKFSVVADSMHIDDRVRMAANARRYEWLRNCALGTGSANVPMVRIGLGNPLAYFDLDTEVDSALANWPGTGYDRQLQEFRP